MQNHKTDISGIYKGKAKFSRFFSSICSFLVGPFEMVTVSMMSRFDCYSKTKHLIIKDGFHLISSNVTKINLYML